MYDMDNEIIVCNSTKTKDIKDIEKAIEKLKMQEKKLVDLYLSSTLNVETINHKNDIIKKEIENLNRKKQQIDPNNDFKEYTIELLKSWIVMLKIMKLYLKIGCVLHLFLIA